MGQVDRRQPAEPLAEEQNGVGQFDRRVLQQIGHVVDLEQTGLGFVHELMHVLGRADLGTLGSDDDQGVALQAALQLSGDVGSVGEGVAVQPHVLLVQLIAELLPELFQRGFLVLGLLDLVSELSEQGHVDAGRGVGHLPLVHLVLEVVHHAGLVRRRVEQEETEAPGRVHHPESGKDVRAGAVADPDYVLYPELVEDRDQVLADLLDRREHVAFLQIGRAVLVSGQVHEHEDAALLDLLERFMIDEVLKVRKKMKNFHFLLTKGFFSLSPFIHSSAAVCAR